jgi:hypothetical protein
VEGEAIETIEEGEVIEATFLSTASGPLGVTRL